MPNVHPADLVKDMGPKSLRGLRALLINMPLRESAVPNCAPLGPALLAARLRDYGADVSILDLNAYRVIDADSQRCGLPGGRHLSDREAAALLERHIGKHGEPHLVGLSGKITTLRWQKAMTKSVKQIIPDAMLISGGGLATEFREGLFEWIPELDGIAHSEGDDTILVAANEAQDRAACLTQSPLIRKKLVFAGARPRDLDALPLPAWDLLVNDVDGFPVLETYLKNEIWGIAANNSSATPFKMTRSINTVSSRGCPYACHFCFRGATGERNYGVRSAKSLGSEFRWLKKEYGVDFIGVLDDNFMVQYDRIEEMKGELGAFCREHGVRWGTHGRLDEAADARATSSRVEAMRDAGCVYIGFGAESASPSVLNAMGKGGFILANGTTRIGGRDMPRTMVDGYQRTIEAGIHANTTWIMGYPGETLEDLKSTVHFIEWQKTQVADPSAVNQNLFVAQAFPGTELFRHPRVRARLREGFGISFTKAGEPVCDQALEDYVLKLDDASKVVDDNSGKPVYYGDMSEDQFLRARELVEAGKTVEILSL